MALSFNQPKPKGRKKMVPAPERLKKLADGRLVPSSHPESGTLWASHKGALVDADELEAGLSKAEPVKEEVNGDARMDDDGGAPKKRGRPKGSKNKTKE
jgi:hypothetical protein